MAFSPVHLIILSFLVVMPVIALLTIVPAMKALTKAGLSPAWAVISVIPIIGWFGLWAFAFARWPSLDAKSDTETF